MAHSYEVADTQQYSNETSDNSEFYGECNFCDSLTRVITCVLCCKAGACEECRMNLGCPPGLCIDCNYKSEEGNTQLYLKDEEAETQVYARDEPQYSNEPNTQIYRGNKLEEPDIHMESKEEGDIPEDEMYTYDYEEELTQSYSQQESFEESLTPLDGDVDMEEESNEIQRQLIIEKDKEIEELIRKVISLPCEKKSIFINFLFYRIMNFKKRIEI